MAQGHQSHLAVCRCGETAVELTGAPIKSVVCYCRSCRKAGRQFEQELNAPPVVNADGGVEYCLYRKDRVRIANGAKHLREVRLKPESPTRRVVADCCGSPMFLDFDPGHWLTVFRDRLPEPPALQMGIMTNHRPEAGALPNGIPNYDKQPPGLVMRLLVAWAGMGFRRPKISW